MRFETLILERFGMFEDATLEFGCGGLHVVYGANEAGKSTALAAMSDLLFGIDERTPFNYRFEYGKLRVGAKLVNSNNARLEFKRRKARAGTLVSLSQPETTLPDAVLAPFLGGVDRPQFHFMFGLDQERLRSGGKQMLDPQGNFAHALFAAGTGLESVNSVLSELDEEIKSLGSLLDRRSKGEIWSAIDRFTGAIASKKADMIMPDHYLAAESARDDAMANRLKVDEQLKILRTRRNFLERGRRVASILVALRTLRNKLAEYDGVPDLPENFAETWKNADDDARSASEADDRNLAELEKLMEKLKAMPAGSPIISFEETINTLNERLGKYLGDQDDIPKLARRLVEANDQIHTILRALGLDVDPAQIDNVIPSRITSAKVRDLIKRGAVIRSELDAARAGYEDAKVALSDTETALENLPPVVDASEANELLAQASKLGDIAQSLADAKVDADAANLALSEATGRLGFWSGTADELAAASVPDATTIERSEERRTAARQSISAIDKKIEETTRDIVTVEADLAGLTAAGEVPSPKAIRDARDERDSQWRALRSGLVKSIEVVHEPLADVAGADVVGAYETVVRHADELVDRREAEAARIARLTTLTANQKKLSETLVGLNSQRKAAAEEMQLLESEWRGLWKDARIAVRPPVDMAKWLNRKDEVLRLLAEARKATGKLREAHTAEGRARTFLEKAGQILGLEVTPRELSELDRRARLALSSIQATATERATVMMNVKTAQEGIRKATSAFEDAATNETKWQAAWKSTVIEIRLTDSAGVPEAEAALGAWGEITGPLTKRNEDQRRYAGLKEDLDRFRSEVAALVSALGENSSAGAPIEKNVRDLKTRLDAAKSALQERVNVQNRIDELQKALHDSRQRHLDANFVIDGIRETYLLAPETDAYDLARRSSHSRGLRDQIDERINELAKAGDALDEATLQAEVDSVPPDQANAELAVMQEEEGHLVAKVQLLAKAETEAEHSLVTLGAKKGAAVADMEAHNAALVAGGHIERWLCLEVARRLLERSVQRYQDENQNPMITRASELFARVASTAANPIERISIDYRNAARPVPIGRRQDGSECGLEGLSEATRDQLFLSLRVAAIEKFCREDEPLPFIADDLFMTSDEQRVLPLLHILAELGQTTQVIAFTHHQHVVDIAKNMPVAGIHIHAMPKAA